MRDQDCAVEGAPCRPTSGLAFGDITSRVDALCEVTTELKVAYENDVNVVALTERAATLRRLAGSLEATLEGIDAALTGLIV